MTRALRITTVGVALAGSVVLLQGSLANASPGGGDPGHGRGDDGRVLEFDVQFSPFTLTDLGEEGLTPGDLITFNDVLLDDGARVGHEVGNCVVVDASGLSNCTAVLTLDGQGTIAYALENAPPPRKVLAVTGGSGRFKGVDGDGVLVENGDKANTGVLTLYLEDDD
jgi:hypothetical protein